MRPLRHLTVFTLIVAAPILAASRAAGPKTQGREGTTTRPPARAIVCQLVSLVNTSVCIGTSNLAASAAARRSRCSPR